MIIHQPEIIKKDGHALLWSRIETDKTREIFPDYIWYRVPEQYSTYLNTQNDSFLISALIAAMHFGEDIEVRGNVSPRLAYSLDEYQFIQSLRFPDKLKRIKVKFENLRKLDINPSAVGTGFSGGVDSFHTVQQHLPESQPVKGYQLTHAVFINGFDIVQENKEKYGQLFPRYQALLAKLNIELVPIESNVIRTVIHHLEYRVFYAPVLFGPAMILSGLFKRFIASNSRDYSQPQVTSAPLPDRLLSTETLDIVHFGATYRREEKIESLSKWHEAQKELRVCGTAKWETKNCSRCEKCIRTMLPLYALGKMEEFTTFSQPLKSNEDSLRLARKFDPYSDHMPMNVVFFREHKSGLLPWLYLASVLGFIRFLILKLLPDFVKNLLMPYGYFVDNLKEVDAYENHETIKLIHSSSLTNKGHS